MDEGWERERHRRMVRRTPTVWEQESTNQVTLQQERRGMRGCPSSSKQAIQIRLLEELEMFD
jgi:hypothetical protein